MSHTLTIRLTADLAEWLREASQQSACRKGGLSGSSSRRRESATAASDTCDSRALCAGPVTSHGARALRGERHRRHGTTCGVRQPHDDHHRWALEVVERIEPPFLTCEAVLAETAFHLQNAAVVVDMVREGLVEIAISVTDQRNQLAALAKKYRDRQPDLATSVSFV